MVLLSGDATKEEGSKSIASGLACATIMTERSRKTLSHGQESATIVKERSEEMRICASEIAFDSKTNALECFGVVEIAMSGRAIKGKDIRIELGAEQAVCIIQESLQPQNIKLPNQPPLQTPVSGTPAASASAEPTADKGAPVAPPPGAAGR